MTGPNFRTMQIEHRAPAQLTPYERNARTHSPEQVEQLVASITEFGFTNPILIDEDDVVIAGHGRLEAAFALQLERVPCIRLEGLTAAQRKAYVIADNKLAMNAGWDVDLLKLEIDDLLDADFNVDLIGFSPRDISDLLRKDQPEADDVPDDAATRAQPGDLWQIGKHRLLCGDSTSADDVEMLLHGERPHLMVTDPPFGVRYDPNQRQRITKSATRKYMSADDDTNREWYDAWRLFPGDVAYVWHSDKQIIGVGNALEQCGFDLRQNIIWAKSKLTLTRTQYKYQHEHCWYAVRNKAHWVGPSSSTTLWNIDKVVADTTHGAQKPVECMQRPIENNSERGDIIYDPFLGSGTTVIAAEQTGRVCYGLELEPAYCDIVLARYEAFTGTKARKLSTNGQG